MGWRELALTVVAPGWPVRTERRSVATVLLLAGVGAPLALVVWAVASGRTWVALSLDRTFLAWLATVIALAVVARLVAVWLWFAARPSEPRVGLAAGAALVVALPGLLMGVGAIRARNDIAPVFTPTSDDLPLFDAEAEADTVEEGSTTSTSLASAPSTTAATAADAGAADSTVPGPTTTGSTLPPLPARPQSGVDPARLDDVWTVLLLGGDAGPGRQGLRTDTMMLFSLHVPSGRASLISIPRDLRKLLFPPGSAMETRHPYGFENLANAVYPIVSSEPSLRDAYDTGDIRPGVVALSEAVGYSFDVTIDDYVLIDMEGFIDLIDAVGGVTIQVSKQLPMPGNIPGASTRYPDTIGPGNIRMNGTLALGYVRSRYADSDFQRTARQRKLLAALARQVSFVDVVGRYGAVTGAVGGTLRTSLTPDELAEVLAVIGGETAIVESVGLVPPLTSIDEPDFQRLAEVVGAVLVAIAEGTESGY